MFSNPSNSKLTPPEWLSVLLFLIVTSSFATLAYLTRTPELPTTLEEPIYITSREIHIQVNGAVSNPGRYTLIKGATLNDLIQKLELLPDADLSKFASDKPLRNGQKIKIPCKKKTRKKTTNKRQPSKNENPKLLETTTNEFQDGNSSEENTPR